nr:hypothetical protein [uncultured Alistipes sp.]
MIMMKSINAQMPQPPSVMSWSTPMKGFARVETVYAKTSQEEAKQQRGEPVLVAGSEVLVGGFGGSSACGTHNSVFGNLLAAVRTVHNDDF